MKKMAILFTFFLAAASLTHAQGRYFTKSGKITFYSSAPMQDIEAATKTAAAVLDAASGAVQFSVLMKSFEFKKALMQEHFNETYVESDKFPNAEFKGVVVNNRDISYNKEGTYNATVQGKLTIHGITKDVESAGTITVAPDGLKTSTVFNISLQEFGIKRPALV